MRRRLPSLLAAIISLSLALAACDDSDDDNDGNNIQNDGGTDFKPQDDSSEPDAATDTMTADALPSDAVSDTDDDDGPDDDASAPKPCELYCDNAMTNCTGDNAIYSERKACEDACEAMPTGDPADTSGNSVYCRAYHAGAPAAGDPATHCPHASVNGGKLCGELCDAYCDQVMANCDGGDELFATRSDCMTACADYAEGAWNDTSGDSVQCRTYHASFLAVNDPATHCPHAGSDGGGVCVN